MSLFIGFDVSKEKLDVAIIDESNQVMWQDQVQNNSLILAQYLLTVMANYPGQGIIGVVESTGRYHLPLLDASIAVGFPCKVYNAILTKQAIRASIRGKKTDKTDAVIIARLGARGEGRIYTEEPYMDIKLTLRSYEKLGTIQGSLNRHAKHLRAMDNELFIKFEELFHSINSSMTEAKEAMFKDVLDSSSLRELSTSLQTIPGIGPFVASCLIGEIQDMTRFKQAKALISYTGFDPRIRQSGHSLNSTGRLTKRGSPHLRRAVFIAANVARQHDKNFKEYYDKKRSEGKTYTVANCAVARKLLLTIRAVWLSGIDYDPGLLTAKML